MMVATSDSTFKLTLPSDLKIHMSRLFNAPPEPVFEASTKPEHVKRWWGCKASTVTTCEIDLRVGGAWRYVLNTPEGEWGFHGIYREIHCPTKIVHTQIFEPMPQHEALVTTTMEDLDGKTKLTSIIRHDSIEARDGHLQSGLEFGVRETYDRLDAVLATLCNDGSSWHNYDL